MEKQKKIFIVDDDLDTCLLLSRFLTKNGYLVTYANSGKSGLSQVKENVYDLVLTDFRLGDLDGIGILAEIKKNSPDVPVIIITAYSDIKTAVNVIKSGAYDYVAKPLIPDEILHIIKKALESSEAKRSAETISKNPRDHKSLVAGDYIIGESKQAKEMFKQIDLVAPTNYSVIIYGESGSGKEAVARLIHQRSQRSKQPFVALDCGAISKELAASELFGHEKGAFTGAVDAKIGHFEMANGGTLFLDEIANLSYDVQATLLRVVQERKVRKLGGNKEFTLDVRILVASNENLMESHHKGRFREDLFHRFNEFSIHVPPLRDRKPDIALFVKHFLTLANAELGKNISGFDDDSMNCFMQYQWPGNIRELKNVIKRAALLADGYIIHSKNLPLEISNPSKFMNSDSSIDMENEFASSTTLKSAAQQAEYETILNVLKQVNFNKTKAAKMLNVDRKTLYNKMKSFNLLGDDEE